MKKNERTAAELAENAKSSVNPQENTNSKSTQVQNLNQHHVSQDGNTTDGLPNVDPRKTTPIRSNPQGNNPMSVDRGQKGPGKKGD